MRALPTKTIQPFLSGTAELHAVQCSCVCLRLNSCSCYTRLQRRNKLQQFIDEERERFEKAAKASSEVKPTFEIEPAVSVLYETGYLDEAVHLAELLATYEQKPEW